MNKTGITTKEFILSVKDACKGKINVESIRFSQYYRIEENGETLEATIFYYPKNDLESTNFSCTVYENDKEFSLQKLLLLVNQKIDKVCFKGETSDAVFETITKTKKKK